MTVLSPAEVVPLEERCAWRRADVASSYIWELADADRAELDVALEHAEAHTTRTLDITADTFPLPTLGPRLADTARELIDGRGVVLIRGVPVERYGPDRASAIYWGIGTHLGRPWPQNHKGHLLGDVTDQGKQGSDPTSRGERDRWGRLPVPLRRLRPRRPSLPRRRRGWRGQPRGRRGGHPQRARGHRTQAGG